VQAAGGAALPLWGLASLALLLGFVGLWSHDLLPPDETRVAGIAREMWTTGAWRVARLGGQAFLEQPPLYYWTQALVFRIAGYADPGLARIPSVLFSLGTLAATVCLGRCFLSRRASALAGLVLLTTVCFANRARMATVDPALMFGVTAALACFARADLANGARRNLWVVGWMLSLCVAFLVKGVVGYGMPMLGIALYLLLRGDIAVAIVAGVGSAVPVCLVASLWLVGVFDEEGVAGVRSFLLENQLGRLVAGAVPYHGGHVRPWHYYLANAPLQFLPWTPLALYAGGVVWRRREELSDREASGLRLVVSTLVACLVVLSLASTKRALYVLPLAPCVALLVAWWLDREPPAAGSEPVLERSWRLFVLGTGAILPVIAFGASGSARLLGLAAIPLAALALGFELHSGRPRATRWCQTALVLALGLVPAFYLQARLDDERGLAPLIQRVEHLTGGDALCALNPSEGLRGAVAFYTDLRLCLLTDLDAVRARAAGADVGWWLVIEAGSSGKGPALLGRAGIAYDIHQRWVADGEVVHVVHLPAPA